ncbi:MAG: PASTA domain-containing protein [Balneolaceae bacterium]
MSIYTLDRLIMPAFTNYNEGVTVPDVTKRSLQEAESTLDLYGLRHEILDRRAHNAYPADYIIDQTPAPRQIVKPNRKIYLTVNTAERPTAVVPDLVNMSLRNAEIQLENYGLTRGTISYESSRFRNTVLRQSIAAGDTVDQGAVVDLAVSDGLGEEIVRVPDITGNLLSEAQQKLREAGLRIGEIRFQPSRNVSPNTVLTMTYDESEITEGDELREGESLNLVVSERFDAREEDEAGAVVDEEENGNDNSSPDNDFRDVD